MPPPASAGSLLPQEIFRPPSDSASLTRACSRAILKENDKNNDGAISREAAKGSMPEHFFDGIDSNKDGKITTAELQNMKPPGGRPPAG